MSCLCNILRIYFFLCKKMRLFMVSFFLKLKAGDGNRTHTAGLGSRNSATKLHPQEQYGYLIIIWQSNAKIKIYIIMLLFISSIKFRTEISSFPVISSRI